MDPVTTAQVARQNVLSAQNRTKAAKQKLEEESIRIRDSSDKFYSSLALFSGGTIALSITYLGYLKSFSGRPILYPKTLIAAWTVLLVCVVASLFCPLMNAYYTHFARLRIYLENLIEQKDTYIAEADNLYLVNVPPEERDADKRRTTEEANARKKDRAWAKKRESIFSHLWTACGWIARVGFPLGLGLLMFFAVKNM